MAKLIKIQKFSTKTLSNARKTTSSFKLLKRNNLELHMCSSNLVNLKFYVIGQD